MAADAHDTGSPGMTPLAWAALLVVYVVWGSTYLGIGIAIESMPPMLHAGIRFLIAAALLAAFLALRRGPGALRASRRRIGSAMLVGLLLLTSGNGLVAIAEQHVSTGLAALLVAAVPLWLVVLRSVGGDRPPLATFLGVAVGFVGVALLSILPGGSSGSAFGAAVLLAASLSWATGSFLAGRLPMPADSFAASVYEMTAGGAALLVLGLARGESLDVGAITVRSWLALGYLIAFGSLLAFTSYAWLLRNAPLSIVGTYAYVNPVVAVLLGALVLSEAVTWPVLLGGAIIVLGVAIVVTTESRPGSSGPAGRPPATRAPRRRRSGDLLTRLSPRTGQEARSDRPGP
ncbi:EamA family transporter [Thermomonospora catenispora]|uniref:EamA family transporter n=1 Tax=Thermomonospora catenispora TaxID=2493090 RepID=UPI00158CE314|nr:EamA family transporter [Thermomonospora catenispora]